MQSTKDPNNKYLKSRPGLSLILILFFLAAAALSSPATAAGINASRELSTTTIYPGNSFTVTVNISAYEALEAPALAEELPVGWSVTEVNNSGARFKELTPEWIWPERLAAGDKKTVVYKVTIPSDSELKSYEILGEVSAHLVPVVPVNGNHTIEVLPMPISSVKEPTGSPTDGGSGGGSGGGGGGGGSPEPNSNIELKEIANQQIFKGTHARYTFRAGNNDITAVEFDPKKSFGKTTAIVEMLNDTSTLVLSAPPGKVYKNMNIWVGNSGFSSPENLENAKISFRVSRAWINEMKIDLPTITLMHFSDERWNPLPTKKLSEDDEYSYFEAETPGFSPFAIISMEKSFQSPEPATVGNGDIQTPNGIQELNGGTAKEGENDENSDTQARDQEKKPESIPGFEAVLMALCLLLYGSVRIISK